MMCIGLIKCINNYLCNTGMEQVLNQQKLQSIPTKVFEN